MQSVNEPHVRFAVVDAYAWDRDFSLEVDDSALEELGSLDPLDYAVYFLVHIRKDGKGTTLQAKPNAPSGFGAGGGANLRLGGTFNRGRKSDH